MANWSALRGFWFARSPWRHRRLILLSRIVSAAITGTDAYAASPSELNKLDKNMQVPERRAEHTTALPRRAMDAMTNAQLLHQWRVPLARAEIAIRKIKWWQAMTEHNRTHLQTMAATCGQLPGEAQTLTEEGSLSPTANPFAVAFSEDLHLFAELSGTEDLFELKEKKATLGGVHLRCEQRHSQTKRFGTH